MTKRSDTAYHIACAHEGCYLSLDLTCRNKTAFDQSARSEGWQRVRVYGGYHDWFCADHAPRKAAKSGRGTKYHARKCYYAGLEFDSETEMKRFMALETLQRGGVISGLRKLDKKRKGDSYIVLEAFTYQGKRQRAISYTPDFAYTENGQQIVEEVKSTATAKARDYSLRKKLFMYTHSEIVFREVIR